MKAQEMIDYMKFHYSEIWEAVNHYELLTLLADFYNIGFDCGKREGILDGYEEGWQDCLDETNND